MIVEYLTIEAANTIISVVLRIKADSSPIKYIPNNTPTMQVKLDILIISFLYSKPT